MGCGVSKVIEQQIEEYQQKISEIQETNAQLNQQLNELKETKRKPIYMVSDQEIDDLYVFQTELDKRFEKIDQNLEKIKLQLQGTKSIQKPQSQIKQVNQNNVINNEFDDSKVWLQNLEENEQTVKQIQEVIFDDVSEKIKCEQSNTIKNQDLKNELDLQVEIVEDLKKTIPKEPIQKNQFG